jgi:hypothetical protein
MGFGVGTECTLFEFNLCIACDLRIWVVMN